MRDNDYIIWPPPHNETLNASIALYTHRLFLILNFQIDIQFPLPLLSHQVYHNILQNSREVKQ
jgi:hypothetical protein